MIEQRVEKTFVDKDFYSSFCSIGASCPAFSYHQLILWLVEIARSYNLLNGGIFNAREFIGNLCDSKCLDPEICAELERLNDKHCQLQIETQISTEEIEEMDVRVVALHRTILSVIVIEEDDNENNFNNLR